MEFLFSCLTYHHHHHHHHHHQISLVRHAYSCEIKFYTGREIPNLRAPIRSISSPLPLPGPFHLLTAGTIPQVLPSVARLSSFLPYNLDMIFPDVICSDYPSSILFHCSLDGSSSWIRSFVRWELHDQGFLKCANLSHLCAYWQICTRKYAWKKELKHFCWKKR